MKIEIDLSDKKLTVQENDSQSNKNNILLEADIVSGCQDTKTPTGEFKAGKFIKDKTNPKFGPIPWSKDKWGNPYGPYFLQILNQKGAYTSYGIHGTRGYDGILGHFEIPPIPRWILEWFVDDDTAKYSYCSHGCIRISNENIKKLFNLVINARKMLSGLIPINIKR